MQTPEELAPLGRRQYGRFDRRPIFVNPLEPYLGGTRRARRLRLKEWIGWTLMHPELSCSMILQDAHYLASSELYVRDAASGRLTQHARNLRGGSLHLPERLYPSQPSVDAKGYAIGYDFGPEGGRHTIEVDIAGTATELPVSVRLTLDGAHAGAPLSVSQPLGRKAAMYTHKAVFPAAGSVTVGDHTYTFDPARDLAILDEHKTFLPYRTRWLWGTFATVDADGIVGANFCRRPAVAGTPGESCLWLPAPYRCEGLDDVELAPESEDSLAPWRVRSADGRLDVVFTPDGRKDVKHQLVLFAIDYWQLYGTYAGIVGDRRVEGVRGVLESMKARL
ncbi:DUF2804 family protein [Nocardioides sp.]|uniref:DUF2804 family protein n=1 Tax=Nocardioides sp. TaxID=35761 RepID=UPI002CFDF9DB|nr:DUF2804 family protein [Nocardioides sp.]HVX54062.1 DUF2804 family protein [Nocardioides sp.]